MAHVGDVHPQAPVAVAVFAQTDGIVKVFRVRRVNRDNELIGQIRPIDGRVRVKVELPDGPAPGTLEETPSANRIER